MSTTVQERLQLSRTPLDTWSKREQLCLASAVSCSGDQNWITVSRTLKTVCGGGGNGNNSNNNRPADWYSQKNCAVQYGHLLESVETTKRKKRSSESSVSSPATVEPPTELLLRRLTEERLNEIQAQMRSDQEMYRKVQQEIEALQSDEMTEQELQHMWQDIEKQQAAARIEEMKMENRLREREQRKKELSGNWRQSKRSTLATPDTTVVDMDVEQQPQTGNGSATGPSPLLTSLLSTTAAAAPLPTASVASVTAPTITSLLTSGTASILHQPAIKNDSAFMTRPISGPPASDSLIPTTPTPTGRSPSQAAPTLSMLLEKNKASGKGSGEAKDSPRPLEEASALTTDVDEPDPIDEQLMEVFQNMEDIMDNIDIDMASVIDDEILKDVDEVEDASPSAAKSEVVDFEDKLDALKREQTNDGTKKTEAVIGSSDDSNDNIPLAAVASQEIKERTQSASELKEETESSVALASEVSVKETSETISLIGSSSQDTTDIAPLANKVEQNETDPSKEKSANEAEEETASRSEETGEANEEPQIPTPEADKPLEEKATPCHTDEENSSQTDSSKHEDPPLITKPTRQSSGYKLSNEEQLKADASEPPQPPPRTPLLRKLPHRDRSESPMVDDDTTTASDHSTARSSTRRRGSSTPLIDSIPNSPASSEHTDDRRETRAASKKQFLAIYSTLHESRHAAPFRRPFYHEHAQRHAELCLRPMDLPTIKRNIDSGSIRNSIELQRDVLLMVQNVLMAYKPHTTQHKTALLFRQDCQAIKEFVLQPAEPMPSSSSSTSTNTSITTTTNTNSGLTTSNSIKTDKDRPSGSKARSGSRKSQRLH